MLDPICSVIWDMFAKMSLYVQLNFSNTWLIVLGIVFLVAGIVAACYIDDKENGTVWVKAILGVLVFLATFVVILFVAWNEFKPYHEIDSDINWIVVSVFLLLAILLLVSTAFSYRVLFTVLFIICMIASAIFFSKFMVAIAVLLGIGVIGGGSTYVGTFTDRNGNSYDVYKKN